MVHDVVVVWVNDVNRKAENAGVCESEELHGTNFRQKIRRLDSSTDTFNFDTTANVSRDNISLCRSALRLESST